MNFSLSFLTQTFSTFFHPLVFLLFTFHSQFRRFPFQSSPLMHASPRRLKNSCWFPNEGVQYKMQIYYRFPHCTFSFLCLASCLPFCFLSCLRFPPLMLLLFPLLLSPLSTSASPSSFPVFTSHLCLPSCFLLSYISTISSLSRLKMANKSNIVLLHRHWTPTN